MADTAIVHSKFIDDLTEYIGAGFAGLYVVTAEPDDFETELRARLGPNALLVEWDFASGMHCKGMAPPAEPHKSQPIKVLEALPNLKEQFGRVKGSRKPNGDDNEANVVILLLHNYHRFMADNMGVIQELHNQIREGRCAFRSVIIVSPVVKLPLELTHDFVVLEHPLPERDHLERIAKTLLEDQSKEVPPAVLDAAVGLTRVEAENAFAKSIASKGELDAEAVWDLKTASLKKDGLLGLHRGGEKFSDIGGLDGMKSFCLNLIQSENDNEFCQPKGIMIVGLPGGGKSMFCKALGNEVGRPVLTLDFGAMKSKYVGESEGNIRRALKIADAMAPCILFADEVEKALAGVGASHVGDSGTSEGMFGTLLSWLNDHTSEVFFVCSANDITKLPAEFTRAERFDRVFFVDLPSNEERRVIWSLYLSKFGLDAGMKRPDDHQWTGAEIKSCCRLAAMVYSKSKNPLVDASRGLVPVAMSGADIMTARREKAHNTYTDANTGQIYTRPAHFPHPLAIEDGESPPTRKIIARKKS